MQKGQFTKSILLLWSSAEEHLLVDLWGQQENYVDIAYVIDVAQEHNYQDALENTAHWAGKRRICRNFTTVCANDEEDEYFDFVYIDARHDFKGVYEDLVKWWPKLKKGGIFAGHDYVTQDDGPAQTRQDWTTNFNGTKDESGTVVKGAVDKFATEVCRQVTVSYRESGWNTWAMRK